VRLTLMERHPLGSQAFMPLSRQPYLVVVAEDEAGRPGALQAFITRGWQGVNYGKGVWHHPLLALGDVGEVGHVGEAADFIVVDRGGAGLNLEEYELPEAIEVSLESGCE
jgi:ureidoglycolate lyase